MCSGRLRSLVNREILSGDFYYVLKTGICRIPTPFQIRHPVCDAGRVALINLVLFQSFAGLVAEKKSSEIGGPCNFSFRFHGTHT